MSAGELERRNHRKYPWIEARGDCGDQEICTNIIRKDIMKKYYSKMALKEGMKTVKNSVFMITKTDLKNAQERLNDRRLFKPTSETRDLYHQFVLESYSSSMVSVARAEYGSKISE